MLRKVSNELSFTIRRSFSSWTASAKNTAPEKVRVPLCRHFLLRVLKSNQELFVRDVATEVLRLQMLMTYL